MTLISGLIVTFQSQSESLLGQEESRRVVNSTTKATDLAQMIKGSGQSQIGSELSEHITTVI